MLARLDLAGVADMTDPQPPIWYLSFAGDDGWLGCCHIEAPSFLLAVTASHLLGCNPGGEVVGLELPREILAAERGAKIHQVLGQLLDREAMEALFGPMTLMPSELTEGG